MQSLSMIALRWGLLLLTLWLLIPAVTATLSLPFGAEAADVLAGGIIGIPLGIISTGLFLWEYRVNRAAEVIVGLAFCAAIFAYYFIIQISS